MGNHMYSGTRHGQIYSALTKALLKARFIEAEKWKKKKKSEKDCQREEFTFSLKTEW